MQMPPTLRFPRAGQLVLDFDGVLCDSATECLHIIWASYNGFGVEAFGARTGPHAVPAAGAARHWRGRRLLGALARVVVGVARARGRPRTPPGRPLAGRSRTGSGSCRRGGPTPSPPTRARIARPSARSDA